jgi:hypothetical protein
MSSEDLGEHLKQRDSSPTMFHSCPQQRRKLKVQQIACQGFCQQFQEWDDSIRAPVGPNHWNFNGCCQFCDEVLQGGFLAVGSRQLPYHTPANSGLNVMRPGMWHLSVVSHQPVVCYYLTYGIKVGPSVLRIQACRFPVSTLSRLGLPSSSSSSSSNSLLLECFLPVNV